MRSRIDGRARKGQIGNDEETAMPQLVKVTTYDRNFAQGDQWMTPDEFWGHVASLPAGWRADWT